jgi:hypothetical protein
MGGCGVDDVQLAEVTQCEQVLNQLWLLAYLVEGASVSGGMLLMI